MMFDYIHDYRLLLGNTYDQRPDCVTGKLGEMIER